MKFELTLQLYYERILPAFLFIIMCVGAVLMYMSNGLDGLATFGITLFMVIIFSVFIAIAMNGGSR